MKSHPDTAPLAAIEILPQPQGSSEQGKAGNLEERLHELEKHNSRLQTSLELYQKSQESHLQHLLRSRAQQQLILRLARHRYSAGDPFLEAARLITQAACEIYEVSGACVWKLDGQQLEPVASYNRLTGRHEMPGAINLSMAPGYLNALHSGRVIDAQSAPRDPRTRELYETYLQRLNVSSCLDATIRLGGEAIGVLSLTQVESTRFWQADEIAFAGELADQLAQVLSQHERRSATHALHLFQRAVEQSASAFLLIDLHGRVAYANPSFSAITQYSIEEVQGQLLSDLASLVNATPILKQAIRQLMRQNNWQCEFKSRRKNLDPYWAQLSISKIYGEDGKLTHYVGIYEDITPTKMSQLRIERLAYTDTLTNLANRHFFIHTLEKRFKQRSNLALCLLLLDIDNFKRINDSLGHATGDKLLCNLARRLHNCLPEDAILARFASNEFAVLYPDSCAEQGLKLGEQLLAALEQPLFVDDQWINLTASIGLACAPQHGQDPERLMKHAGLALHKAKATGKDQLHIFTEALNAEASYKLFIENNLRHALERNELEVFYQPKLCLQKGHLLGLEALLRWRHPEKGMIAPDKFIGVAEETGLIIPIGNWVIRQACKQIKLLGQSAVGYLPIAINLSPRQFASPDLVNSIASILHSEQLPAHLLELELTESLLLEASDDTRQQLRQLKALGLSLALDDFGTGYSSLSYLKKFPVDIIKIDRSFIQDIPDDQDGMEITSAVIAMAHKLRLKVVAEGIETTAQLSFLRRQRCDIGQGYLFDHPIPGPQLLDALQRYPCRTSSQS